MRIVYRSEALADLQNIHDYYEAISAETNAGVFDDIFEAISTLQTFPKVGRQLEDGRRRFVSPKYRFVISHHSYGDRVEIVGVYRQQDRK